VTPPGARQYLKRVNPDVTDHEMLVHAVRGDPDYTFVWKPDQDGGRYANGSVALRLVTVMPKCFYISDPGVAFDPMQIVGR